MKKLSIALILCAISVSTFACHFYETKICKDKAYLHGSFSPNSIFQFRFYGSDTTVIKEFSTNDASGEIDSTIIFDIPDGTKDFKIQFRNHYLDGSPYNLWAGNYNANFYYEAIDSLNSACFTMPVTISGLGVKKIDNDHVQVVFNAETQADHYLISKSRDGHAWEPVANVKTNTSGKYNSGVLSLMAGTVSLSLLLIPFIGFKRNRKAGIIIALMFCLFYTGCKKEIVKSEDKTPYKVISVQAIDISGKVIGDAVIKSF